MLRGSDSIKKVNLFVPGKKRLLFYRSAKSTSSIGAQTIQDMTEKRTHVSRHEHTGGKAIFAKERQVSQLSLREPWTQTHYLARGGPKSAVGNPRSARSPSAQKKGVCARRKIGRDEALGETGSRPPREGTKRYIISTAATCCRREKISNLLNRRSPGREYTSGDG